MLAIFASRLLNGKPPRIYEDGNQQRDFVSVYDVARACRLALNTTDVQDCVINIGIGQPITINEVARRAASILGKEQIIPEVTAHYRVGDIRHCFADIGLARRLLGYEPQVSFHDGLTDLAGWLETQAAPNAGPEAHAELTTRGLAL